MNKGCVFTSPKIAAVVFSEHAKATGEAYPYVEYYYFIPTYLENKIKPEQTVLVPCTTKLDRRKGLYMPETGVFAPKYVCGKVVRINCNQGEKDLKYIVDIIDEQSYLNYVQTANREKKFNDILDSIEDYCREYNAYSCIESDDIVWCHDGTMTRDRVIRVTDAY